MRTTLMVLIFAACAFGQANPGSIRGTVSDSSGAVVPGAKIVLANVRTGVQSSSMTDGLGAYLFEFLPPGEYRVEAEVAGFKKFIRENITLDVARQLRVDIGLEAGQVTETVSVQARASLIETETGTLSTTVENQQVTSLPLISRNPQDLRIPANQRQAGDL